MSDKALLSFTLASCSTLSTRLRSLVPTPIIFRRLRVKSRSSRNPRGGTKLGRIMACRSRCASHQLSFLSVLCPFRFFTSCGLARYTRTLSSSTLNTGFQYEPVLSMTTWVTPSACSH